MKDITSKFKNFSIQSMLTEWDNLLKPATELSEAQLKVNIEQVCPIEAPKPNSIVFVSENLKALNLETSELKPKAVVLTSSTQPDVISLITELNIICLLSPNPKLAMALISQKQLVNPRINSHFQFSDQNIHPTALVHPSVKIAENVFVGPNVIIGKNCVIGEHCKIGSNVVLEADVTLGSYCEIYPNTVLGWASELGDHCVVQSNTCIGSDGFGFATSDLGEHYPIPHLGHVRLGHHVHIGAGCQIDRGTYGETYIGDFTKLDNIVHIAHNCKIGKSCLITAGFLIAGSSEIGDFFVAGGRTTVTGHIKVTDHVQVAGLSVIQKSVAKPGKYGGYPLVPLSQHLKTTSSLSKILDFRKDINRIKKYLKLDSD